MRTPVTLALLLSVGASAGHAQWAVVDVAGLQQSITNYSALTKQITQQATQISNQVQQIRQYEMQLKRLGDMSSVKDLVGFSEFRADLNLPTQITSWSEGLTLVNGQDLFGDTRGGVFLQISPEFRDFDGAVIERDASVYKPAHDVVVTVDEFKAVQSDVLTRREDLKRAIARTSEALQAANTEAEQQKLDSVLKAQYGQLAAIDSEVSLSAAEVQVKAAEATAMNAAQNEAEAEARRKLAQQEVKKVSSAFKPSYECLLQYVTERSLSR